MCVCVCLQAAAGANNSLWCGVVWCLHEWACGDRRRVGVMKWSWHVMSCLLGIQRCLLAATVQFIGVWCVLF